MILLRLRITVWKLQIFPATHILREINVNIFGLKYLHFDRFEGYQFKFLQILAEVTLIKMAVFRL